MTDPIAIALAPGGALFGMAAFKQFLIYELRPSKNDPLKMDKIPVAPYCWKTKKEDLLTAEQALALYATHVSQYEHGVGFVFTADDPFVFFDLDQYFVDGQWLPLATEMCSKFAGCAIEVSSSKKGLHIFGTCERPIPVEFGNRNKAHRLEFYTYDRFVALTGFNATGDCMTPVDDAVLALVTEYFPPKPPSVCDWAGGGPRPDWNGPTDDDQLIAKMLGSGGAKAAFGAAVTFRDLWEANADKLGSCWPANDDRGDFDRSSADMSLASHLAFWTGCDAPRMERLMNASGLVREKYERADYMQATIEKAIAGCKDVYGAVAPAAAFWTTEPQNGKPAIPAGDQLSLLISDNPEFASVWAGGFDGAIERVATATAGNCQGTLDILLMHPGNPGRTPELEAAIREACRKFVVVDPLQIPLANPLDVFHPRQIEYRKNKDTGEYEYKGAKGTSENLQRLCNAYGLQVRYNELAHTVDLFVKGEKLAGDLAKNIQISMLENICRINDYPAPQVMSNIDAVAFENAYNPAVDWIKSKPWDGVPRLRSLFQTLTLGEGQDVDFAYTLFRKWFVGAVAIVTGHTQKFEFVLTLVDPTGGMGKTRWANKLCPSDLMADGLTLDTRDKDSVLLATSKWLVELGEVDSTFKRSDISALKAFLSRYTDEIRPAYARATNAYSRRTAFMASVNQTRFLMDDTNNRRFWPIAVTAVDYMHTIDMQQVWAEVLVDLKGGATWYLDKAENIRIGESNEDYRATDPVEEMIESAYDLSAVATRELTATQIAQELGFSSPNKQTTMKIASHLSKLGVKPSRRVRGLSRYKLPAKNINWQV